LQAGYNGRTVHCVAKADRPQSVHPADPLNSYRAPTFRGWTGAVILATIAALWLAYSAALNNPDLQSDMDGRDGVQGPLYPPDHPQPGGQ